MYIVRIQWLAYSVKVLVNYSNKHTHHHVCLCPNFLFRHWFSFHLSCFSFCFFFLFNFFLFFFFSFFFFFFRFFLRNFILGLFKHRYAVFSLRWPMPLIQHWSSVKRPVEVHPTFKQSESQITHGKYIARHFPMRVLIFICLLDYFHLILFFIFYFLFFFYFRMKKKTTTTKYPHWTHRKSIFERSSATIKMNKLNEKCKKQKENTNTPIL